MKKVLLLLVVLCLVGCDNKQSAARSRIATQYAIIQASKELRAENSDLKVRILELETKNFELRQKNHDFVMADIIRENTRIQRQREEIKEQLDVMLSTTNN